MNHGGGLDDGHEERLGVNGGGEGEGGSGGALFLL